MLLDNKEAQRAKRMTLFENAVTKVTRRKLLISVFGANFSSLLIAFIYLILMSAFFTEIRNSLKEKADSLDILSKVNSRSL